MESGTGIIGGTIAVSIGAVKGVVVGGAVILGASTVVVKSGIDLYQGLNGNFDLPIIIYTPERIFSNDIPLFNINFFNPADDIIAETITEEEAKMYIISDCLHETMQNQGVKVYSKSVSSMFKLDDETIKKEKEKYGYAESNIVNFADPERFITEGNIPLVTYSEFHYELWRTSEGKYYFYEDYYSVTYNGAGGFYNYYIYDITDVEKTITEEEIQNEIDKNTKAYKSSSAILQKTVSSIYKTLRVVATVALLTILVYVGIRMVLSSASKDKAKYKQMLVDWLVAFIMLFVLHYIMAFIIDISESLTNIFRKSNIENVLIPIPSDTRIKTNEYAEEINITDGADGVPVWSTNFVGYARYNAGLVQLKGFTLKGVVHTIMYMVLVIDIVVFTFQYLRRVLYMAFLTMIAPLVAITYPLDKINDGKAQGFSMWLREYIFNALLQPIHCIIYVVIMGSVLDLVVEYPAYALVALGFMIPAEKFIRKMFGFEKAGTVGAFGGAAGAALLMGGLQKLVHNPHGKKNDDNGAKGTDKGSTKVRTIESTFQSNRRNAEDVGNIPDPDQLTMDFGDGQNGGGANSPNPGTGRNEASSDGDTHVSNDDEVPGQQRMDFGDSQYSNNSTSTTSGIRNGLNSLTGHYKRRLINAGQNMKPLRALRRGVTYGAGALTFGTIGLAAGIASGDPSKALQYTTAGALAGGRLGRNLGETASNFVGLEDASKAYMAGALGDRYTDIERAKYNRDFKNNVSNFDTAMRKVDANGWAEMSKENGIIDNAIDYGITDIGTMCNIYKTQQKIMSDSRNFPGISAEDAQKTAFEAYSLSKKFPDYSYNKRTQENLVTMLKNKNFTDAEIATVAPKMAHMIKTYKDTALD